MPILPTRRRPKTAVKHTITIQANKAQKAARYPVISAFGDVLSTSDEEAVLESAMTDVIVNPIDVPSWAQVLKTAPPRACVPVGKMEEIMSKPTVKSTFKLKSWRTC